MRALWGVPEMAGLSVLSSWTNPGGSERRGGDDGTAEHDIDLRVRTGRALERRRQVAVVFSALLPSCTPLRSTSTERPLCTADRSMFTFTLPAEREAATSPRFRASWLTMVIKNVICRPVDELNVHRWRRQRQPC